MFCMLQVYVVINFCFVLSTCTVFCKALALIVGSEHFPSFVGTLLLDNRVGADFTAGHKQMP